jgi:hypothetical protein
MKPPFPSLQTALALLVIFLLSHLVAAQEVIPLEKAQKGAHMLAETVGKLGDGAVTVDPDLEKPFAIKGGSVAFMIIPDKALTADKLAALGETITPVAQFWTMDASIAVGGRLPASENLRFYTIKDGDNEKRVQLYLVGAMKNAQGQTELAVFGQGKEPLVRVSIGKSSSSSQELPIELTGRKNDESSGTLTLHLPGQYQADILLVKAE